MLAPRITKENAREYGLRSAQARRAQRGTKKLLRALAKSLKQGSQGWLEAARCSVLARIVEAKEADRLVKLSLVYIRLSGENPPVAGLSKRKLAESVSASPEDVPPPAPE